MNIEELKEEIAFLEKMENFNSYYSARLREAKIDLKQRLKEKLLVQSREIAKLYLNGDMSLSAALPAFRDIQNKLERLEMELP
jgi:hypothetical protein